MSESHGKFVWYDAMHPDLHAAGEFYKDAIGWNVKDSNMPNQSYLILSAGEVGIGGLMTIPAEAAGHGAHPMWMGYIEVDDVDEYATKVKATGGGILRGPEDIPGVGRFAVATDPYGATFNLFKGTGGQMPVPVERGTPGHVGWAELHAGDGATAWSFYEGLFGWSKAGEVDMGPMGIYQMFAPAGETSAIGGMMTKMPQTPAAMWLYYFNVDAVDAAVETAKGAGAQLINGPMEVPGGQWIAQFLDPQGAMFAVVAFKR